MCNYVAGIDSAEKFTNLWNIWSDDWSTANKRDWINSNKRAAFRATWRRVRSQIRNHSDDDSECRRFLSSVPFSHEADVVTVVVGIRRSASRNNDRAAPSVRCAFGTRDTLHGDPYNGCLRTTSRMILALSPFCTWEPVVGVIRADARARQSGLLATRGPLSPSLTYLSLVSLSNYAGSITAVALRYGEHFDVRRIRRRSRWNFGSRVSRRSVTPRPRSVSNRRILLSRKRAFRSFLFHRTKRESGYEFESKMGNDPSPRRKDLNGPCNVELAFSATISFPANK